MEKGMEKEKNIISMVENLKESLKMELNGMELDIMKRMNLIII